MSRTGPSAFHHHHWNKRKNLSLGEQGQVGWQEIHPEQKRGLQSLAQAPEVEEAGRAGPWVRRAAGSQTPSPQELAETTLAVLCPPASHSAIHQFPSIIAHRSTHKRVGPSKDFHCQILKSELGIKEGELLLPGSLSATSDANDAYFAPRQILNPWMSFLTRPNKILLASCLGFPLCVLKEYQVFE